MSLLVPDYCYDLLKVVRCIDGDTIEAVIGKDVGFHLLATWTWRLRVEGVNCPEIKGANKAAGYAAREFTADWLAQEPCIVRTTGKTSFERWLAEVTRADGSSLADALVAAGHSC